MIIIKAIDKSWHVKKFQWKKWSSLLSQLENNDVKIKSSCRRGNCWFCLCKIKSWKEHLIWIRKNYSFNSNVIFTCDVTVKDEEIEGEIEIEV